MAILDFDISDVELPGSEKGTAISLTGSIDATTNQQFEQELTDIITQGVKKVILVLRGIKYINSTGLGTIVKCVDLFREAGGDIKMVGIPTKVIALFEMLGLLALFETFDTIEEAVTSFSTAEVETGGAPKRVREEYPVQLKCTSCGAGVNIKSAGKYKCPKCGDFFSAEDDGTVETYAIKKPNVVQMQIPCDARFVDSVKMVAASSVSRFGGGAELVTSISSSIDEVFSLFDNTSNLPNDTIGILIVTDENKFSMGFVNYADNLRVDQDDLRIKTIEQYMDMVEVIDLPAKGNMIKMNKVFA